MEVINSPRTRRGSILRAGTFAALIFSVFLMGAAGHATLFNHRTGQGSDDLSRFILSDGETSENLRLQALVSALRSSVRTAQALKKLRGSNDPLAQHAENALATLHEETR